MKNYSFSRNYDKVTNVGGFKLHNHNGYEIYVFIKGDAQYIVEGTTYSLKPYDVINIRNDEMHTVSHNSLNEYERIVINLDYDFFAEQKCEEYKAVFTNREAGTNNKISSSQIKESGIYDALCRLERYVNDVRDENDAVVKAVLVEILYMLNGLSISHEIISKDKTIRGIISYINSNLTSKLDLNTIASEFYISKYHLCRIFKKATGLTVNKYISYKRILLVQELIKNGGSISTACLEAGFGDYSNFYKTYIKEKGVSPRNDENFLKV